MIFTTGETMELKVKDREVVVPGQILASGMEYLPSHGTYRIGDDIRANRLGLIKIDGKIIKSIPMAGVYLPQKNDVIIGKVIDILMSGWRIEMNGPYSAVLQVKDATFDFIAKGADLTKYFDLGDYVVAKIIQVTSQNLVDLTCKGPGLRKLEAGRIMKVSSPHKVPRIIGTKGSMISMIKKATNCKIVVGQNGIIWIDGSPDKEHIAVNAITLIEEFAHMSGLTDRVKSFLIEQTGISEEELAKAVAAEEESQAHDMQERERRSHHSFEGGDRPPRRDGAYPPRRDGGYPPRRDGGGEREGERRRPYPPRREQG
jgi:exosome complex component RRP4